MPPRPWPRGLSCKSYTTPSLTNSTLLVTPMPREFQQQNSAQTNEINGHVLPLVVGLHSVGAVWISVEYKGRKLCRLHTQTALTCPPKGYLWHPLDTYQENLGTESPIINSQTLARQRALEIHGHRPNRNDSQFMLYISGVWVLLAKQAS